MPTSGARVNGTPDRPTRLTVAAMLIAIPADVRRNVPCPPERRSPTSSLVAVVAPGSPRKISTSDADTFTTRAAPMPDCSNVKSPRSCWPAMSSARSSTARENCLVAVLIVRVIAADAETPGTVSATVPTRKPSMPVGRRVSVPAPPVSFRMSLLPSPMRRPTPAKTIVVVVPWRSNAMSPVSDFAARDRDDRAHRAGRGRRLLEEQRSRQGHVSDDDGDVLAGQAEVRARLEACVRGIRQHDRLGGAVDLEAQGGCRDADAAAERDVRVGDRQDAGEPRRTDLQGAVEVEAADRRTEVGRRGDRDIHDPLPADRALREGQGAFGEAEPADRQRDVLTGHGEAR